MGLLNRFEQDNLRLTRIEVFSDGVFAIVVTLLLLESKVPPLQDRRSVDELGGQLLELLPKFLRWLISFFLIGRNGSDLVQLVQPELADVHAAFWFIR
jgi:uncharacterized membrane protein